MILFLGVVEDNARVFFIFAFPSPWLLPLFLYPLLCFLLFFCPPITFLAALSIFLSAVLQHSASQGAAAELLSSVLVDHYTTPLL